MAHQICIIQDDRLINNGVCDLEMNHARCCFDGVDCQGFGDCPVEGGRQPKNLSIQFCFVIYYLAMTLYGDGFCDEFLNIEGCDYDGGDCSLSRVCNRKCRLKFQNSYDYGILNGICQEELMVELCCYDGGDCPCSACKCPSCPMFLQKKHSWLGDNVCDPELNRKDCCHDLGDCGCIAIQSQDWFENIDEGCIDVSEYIVPCHTCPIPKYNHISDGLCDIELNNKDCCMDGGDCDGARTRCMSCNITSLYSLNFRFLVPAQEQLGNNACDPELDTLECCFDEGDCTVFDDICPTCRQHPGFYHEAIGIFGDGICQPWFLNSKECCYDNGDCSFQRTSLCFDCSDHYGLMDGFCDEPVLAYYFSFEENCVVTCLFLEKYNRLLL